MTTTPRVRLRATISALATITALLDTGCGTSPKDPPISTERTSAAPGVLSQVNPQWMELGTGQGWNWETVARTLTRDYQEFSVRPFDDTDEFSPDYNGCGCSTPVTAVLTVHAPGTFDPTRARSGEPVSVHGAEGYFTPAVNKENATLTWAYAPGAWAAIRARTATTKQLGRLLELAGGLRPATHLPVRLPLSLKKLPASMPFSSINVAPAEFPTHVTFDTCQRSPAAREDCSESEGQLKILLWPGDGYPEHRSDHLGRHELFAIPVSVGGKDGHLHVDRAAAAVKVKPGMVATFELTANMNIQDVLADVEWAPNLDDAATWPEVATWTK